MFHEYAVEPGLLCSWDRFRLFSGLFGWSRGRLISRYPKAWKRSVYESSSTCGDIERKRIEQGLAGIDDKLIRRQGATYNPEEPWVSNAVTEYGRMPFHAILAVENQNGAPAVILGDDLTGETDERIRPPHGGVPRNAVEFADSLSLLVKCSKVVALVDPHFSPNEDRFVNTLTQVYARAADAAFRANDVSIELHVALEPDPDPNIEQRRQSNIVREMEARLPLVVPTGKSLIVRVWKRKPTGQKLHNRYVLSDLGGVSFGTGLDENDTSAQETDDLHRMEGALYATRWAEYLTEERWSFYTDVNATPAFECVVKIVIRGS